MNGEDISKIKKRLDQEHMTWGDLMKKMPKVLGQMAYDAVVGDKYSKQREVLEKVNSIDLSTPEKLNQAEQKMFEYWAKSLTGGNIKDRQMCYQTCIALTARVMASKSGFVDAKVDFYSDSKTTTQAYVQPEKDRTIHLNLESIAFSRENLFDEPIFPVSDTATRLMKIESGPIKTIAHEIQHFSQTEQVLKEEQNKNPSNVTKIIKQEEQIRETETGEKFYRFYGDEDFASEIDANLAGLIDGANFVDGLLGYIEKKKNSERADEKSEIETFPDVEVVKQKMKYSRNKTIVKETKLIEHLAETIGYEVDKNGNFVTRKDIKNLIATYNDFEENIGK